jgi:hypothetical protein
MQYIIDMKRACLSIRFLLCTLGVLLILLIASSGQIEYAPDALYLFNIAVGGSGSIIMITAILPILVYATSFAIDWESHSTGFWMVRSGIDRYTISKYISAGFSGFLSTGFGMTLFILLMLLRFPLFEIITTGNAYELFLLNNQPVLYAVYFIVHYSLSAALMTAVAFWVSTLIPNRFTTIAAPLVIYFSLFRIIQQMALPLFLQPVYWVEGIYNAGTPSASLTVKVVIVLVLFLLMGIASVKRVRKLVQND